MKNIFGRYVALFLTLVMCLFALSCTADTKNEDSDPMDMSAVSSQDLESYVLLGKYTGLDVKAGSLSKDEAVWKAVKEKATVRSYPEQQVLYYISQIEAQYKYYAEQADMSYDEMLREVGATEKTIRTQAESLAIDDVIYELVRRDANITLGESEKQSLFDKYVEKYVSDYGYTEQYVKENMSELIYDSMLYDKTTEYLIKNNEIS